MPVSLLIDEPEETESAANRAGYRFFTGVDSFLTYVQPGVIVVDANPQDPPKNQPMVRCRACGRD